MGDNNNWNMNAYETEYGLCPSWALSLGYMGVAAGAVLSNWGSAVSCEFGCWCMMHEFMVHGTDFKATVVVYASLV